MTDQTDSHLLKAYAERRLEPAFTELVRRHMDFVHSAATRMVRDPHLAEDVTQGVFIALARQAPELVERATVAGWLHRTAQNIAAQTIRTIERRRAREQEAAAMNELLSSATDASWEQIQPHLDAALGELSDSDRDAVVLRYFQKKSAAEIATILSISDEAAQKRVSRAVERLREFFSKRKITVGAGVLTVLISANAVQSAPVGLVATVSAAAVAGTAATTSTIIAATTKTIAMTTLQKTLVTATVAVLAGAGIYEARQAAQLRDEVEVQASLAGQIQQLQNSYAEATNRLADLLVENARLKFKPDEMELVRLRGEVTRLRSDASASPTEQAAKAWAKRVELLKQYAQQEPGKAIPEMKYLTEDDWLTSARTADLDSENGMRKALQTARTTAKGKVADIFSTALRTYLNSNGRRFPTALQDLKPYFGSPVDD
ncbi:MAG TPA: sigma-70 family RNA polymerase sigma factor, partial [Candidatus Paceibacterota bacterium]|nr:sigma-70 family RNA polymerase sigma factor [Candidatus Paceibacterota bacterium]